MVDDAESIALELRRQYSIGYYPTDLKQDGKWHKIKVRVNSLPGWARLRVRAREGFYASR
jgi:Ca-activated chloride channel family protein